MAHETLDYGRPAKRGRHHGLVWISVCFTLLSTPGLIFVVAYSSVARRLLGPVNETALGWIVLVLPVMSLALSVFSLQLMRAQRQEMERPVLMRWMLLSVAISATWVVWGVAAWAIMRMWSGFSRD